MSSFAKTNHNFLYFKSKYFFKDAKINYAIRIIRFA